MPPSPILSGNILINLIVSKRWGFVRHAVLVLFAAYMYGFFDNSMMLHAQKVGISARVFAIGQFIVYLFDLLFIYFNLYVLIPRLLIKGKFSKYIFSLFIIGSLYFFVGYISQKIYVDYFGKNAAYALKFNITDYLDMLLLGVVIIASTTAFKVFKFWVNDQQRFALLEKEKVSAELDQLKNQVNPHFLFNTLNNLHVLSLTNPPKASEIILGLSDVLRYQIYDAKQEQVYLQKDIEILEQYLTIEKIRRDDLSFSIHSKGDIYSILVPPLLFINFVENAIKHSNSRQKSEISVQFLVENKTLVFTCSNTKGLVKNVQENSGFGLKNVRKRLDLMYGKAYELIIDEQETAYNLKLTIPTA
jgi:two-component system, LytTR family, sensor kinase